MSVLPTPKGMSVRDREAVAAKPTLAVKLPPAERTMESKLPLTRG